MWSVPMRRSPRWWASSAAVVNTRLRASGVRSLTILSSLSVLRVNGLAADAEGVADLLPRPALFAGQLDVDRFHLFGQTVEHSDRPQTGRGVVGAKIREYLGRCHSCQLRLTDTLVSI